MIIVVQHIITRWTKESRSAAGATKRNAVPDMLPVPSDGEPAYNPTLFEHRVVYSESDQFERPKQTLAQRQAMLGRVEKYRCVQLRWEEGQVKVVYAYEPFKGGAPKRTTYPRQVLSLDPGQWGRVTYNGRHVSLFRNSGWSYRQDMINIAFLEDLQEKPFKGEPKAKFSDLTHLL